MAPETAPPTTARTPALATRTPASGPRACASRRSTAGERQIFPVHTARTVRGCPDSAGSTTVSLLPAGLGQRPTHGRGPVPAEPRRRRIGTDPYSCLLYTSPSPRDGL